MLYFATYVNVYTHTVCTYYTYVHAYCMYVCLMMVKKNIIKITRDNAAMYVRT